MPSNNRAFLRGAVALTTLISSSYTDVAAQERTPGKDILVFTMVIQGAGSDPKRHEGIARSTQNWTLYRGVAGWFEVETTRRKTGKGANARERLEFKRPRDGGHAIQGTRRDWARIQYREIGEGGSYADYTAEETLNKNSELDPPERFNLTLTAPTGGEPFWDAMFLPLGWLPELEQQPRYQGSAKYKPGQAGGFGEPYDYITDDMQQRSSERTGGREFIDTGYHPGLFSDIPMPLKEMSRRWPATFDGKVASGHVEIDLPISPRAQGEFKMRMVLHWTVRAELSDVELDVRSPNYEQWRPEATLDSSAPRRVPGEALLFAAQLRARDRRSQRPLPKITKVTWRLLDTSTEPGIAMNWPYGSDDRRPDLELVDGWSLAVGVGAEDQQLVVRPEGSRSEIAVFPFDWGAFATLRVEAQLEDGRTIEGRLQGVALPSDPTQIPIPCAAPGSRIARSWQREAYPGFKADTDDLDAQPAGKPGVDGDGFTAYEEYRGFVWGGRHLTTDPARKDLFIRREASALEAGPGIARFEQLSGLAVHMTLRTAELPAEQDRRVVNVNVGAGPSNGPQTAIYVRSTLLRERFNDLIRPGSRPATVPAILVPTSETVATYYQHLGSLAGASRQGEQRDALTHFVVQALFQTCGVSRPGRTDRVARGEWFADDPATGIPAHFRLDGKRVILEVAPGQEAQPLPGQTAFYLVGARGGAHSGPEHCLMRDWFADLYCSSAQRDGMEIYRLAPTTAPGTRLGSTRQGTGINAAGHVPEPCFGDSAVAEPAARQLVVRDSAQ